MTRAAPNKSAHTTLGWAHHSIYRLQLQSHLRLRGFLAILARAFLAPVARLARTRLARLSILGLGTREQAILDYGRMQCWLGCLGLGT